MSEDGQQQQTRSTRSSPGGDVEDEEELTDYIQHTNSDPQQQQQQTAPPPTAPPTNTQPLQAARDAAPQPFPLDAGFREPPTAYVQLNQLAVNRQDLTALYGAAEYPSLDYGYSFAQANMQHLPRGIRRVMERIPSTVRPPPPTLNPFTYQPRPRVPNTPQQEPPPVAQGLGQSPPQPSSPTPAHPTTPAPAPPAYTTTRSPPTARNPGETHLDAIKRHHNIDINNRALYTAGTAAVPQNIQDLVAQIRGLRTHATGYPLRTALKEMRGHFMQTGGKLRWDSGLWEWYGDTRLFERRVWYYLVTEGTGRQVPR